MKKATSVLTGLLFLAASALYAQSGSANGFSYAVNPDNTNTITITAYTGSASVVIIPFAINNLLVTGIGDNAFGNLGNLAGVTIPAGVTSIGDFAFNYCNGLTNIVIPDGVASIGGGAFLQCSALPNVVIPGSVTNIGDDAFDGCGGLTNVTLSNGLASIGDDAFYGCYRLVTAALPESVESIGRDAFYNCNDLLSMTIPSNVTCLENNTFAYCTALTNISLPGGLTSIGAGAFYDCSGLRGVTISGTVTNLGGSAFAYCMGLTNITIPASVGAIGEYMFYGCSGLTGAVISNGVTGIADYAFENCSALASVSIPGSVTSIGDYEFYSDNLTNVTISGGVTNIGYLAFGDCANLAAITVDAQNTFYSSVGGVLFNAGQTTLIEYPQHISGGNSTNYVIPGSVTSIGDNAFLNCGNLTDVTIPGSVANIGEDAFENCEGLANITIPDGVTSIGDGAFSGSYNLIIANIPGSVTNIGNGAFENCDYLTIVYFLGNAPTVGLNVFYDDYSATAYYLSGATGWGATFGGIPTVMLNSSAPTGSLQVTIAPLGAINAGSQWQIFVNQTYWWYPEMNIGSYGSGATDTNLLTGVSYLVTPVAGSGYNFIGWSGDATGDANPLTITATSNMVITANFAPDTTNVNLTIITNGNGNVSPNLNGKNLKPDARYTLTATAASGWVFSGWTGSITPTNRNPLTIEPSSSFVLQANFITNPFPAFKGAYTGLFSTAGYVSVQSIIGMLRNLIVGTNGIYSGSLVINGAGHAFSGKFDPASLSATSVIPFPNSLGGPLTVDLTLTNNPANAAP
jgi:uncharacterized repeat protein (TIGR02543 family)